MEFSGKVLRKSQVVFSSVKGEYEMRDSGRLKSWQGYFEVAEARHFLMPGQYDLEMDDGLKAPIIIQMAGYGQTRFAFVQAHAPKQRSRR